MKLSELFKELAPLGLEEKEGLILASLFLTGTRSVTQISENAGLKRTHAYNILRVLQGKGLVHEVVKSKVKHFSPPKPEELLAFLARQKEALGRAEAQVHGIIPKLAVLAQSGSKKPEVRFFWGVDGLLSIYRDTLACQSKCIQAFCDFQTVFPPDNDKQLNRWMWEYAQKRADSGIVYKGILNRSPASNTAFVKGKKQLRELKVVENIDFPLEINIYDQKVAFMSSASNFMGILIEDPAVANMLRGIHALLWNLLPEYHAAL